MSWAAIRIDEGAEDESYETLRRREEETRTAIYAAEIAALSEAERKAYSCRCGYDVSAFAGL